MRLDKKKKLIQKRRWRIRKKVTGTSTRPRLTICITNMHIHAQCIDDDVEQTITALSSMSKSTKDDNLGNNIKSAIVLGNKLGAMMRAAGIEKCVFDRAGRRYHGRVKAFADAVRESGVQF